MSDSLKATVIVIRLVSTISAKPVLDAAEVPELPRPPEVLAEALLVAALLAVPEPPEPALPDVPVLLELEPAEIASPGAALDRLTTVPLAGARRLVSASAVRALRTASSALSTEARAAAMADGDGVGVVVVVLLVVVAFRTGFVAVGVVVRVGVVRAGVVARATAVVAAAGAATDAVVVVGFSSATS